jgi:ATP-dependent DNA helicase RecQ
LGIASRCLAIDLEVSRAEGVIHRLAAIRGDRPDVPLIHTKGKLSDTLPLLVELAQGAEFVVGHHLISFDLPHLRAVAPESPVLRLPAIDTLRLSPLAFPRNPYHRLVKHYKDGGLLRARANDPELDARLCLELLGDEEEAFRTLAGTNAPLIAAFHWLCGSAPEDTGFDAFFQEVRGLPCPDDAEGRAAILQCLQAGACITGSNEVIGQAASLRWPLAYALAWHSVAGGNSVLPPWVRHEFPETAGVVRRLRDTRCGDLLCGWCREHHNPRQVLKQWFGFEAFRPAPACDDGRAMQEAIVEASMQGQHVLGILPTGTGKSVCYQVPALSRYENTGALTVVISPLVALMADQVQGLQGRGVVSCAALNGLLSLPERAEVLEKVRLGDIAILLVSPEQLRNRGFRKAVAQREIGGWVMDEAHCLSKWGQDFRTDYRYVGRFIQESAVEGYLPPVMCLTATAKPEVIADIRGYFEQRLGVELQVFNGGASRNNLDFVVYETTPAMKLNDIHKLLNDHLDPGDRSGAIIYCATRRQTEDTAQALTGMGWGAAHFHAGLKPESKKVTQQRFISGDLRVMAATNAFGMGIDKPDVRLVVHADIPGSLENYVQEAGRAGRDQEAARCVLLYCEDDIEQQFGLSARSRLPQHEIQAVLRALRRMAGKRRAAGTNAEVIATPGEILTEDEENEFFRDSATDDTRVRTAVAWLEEAQLVSREENRYEVFPSSLRVTSLEEVDKKLAEVDPSYRRKLRQIAEMLLITDPTEGVATDELMGAAGLTSTAVARALHDLEQLGILSNDTVMTALVHVGVAHGSRQRLERASAMEVAIIDALREKAPDLEKGGKSILRVRMLSQQLKDAGFEEALPELVWRILSGLESDRGSEDGGLGSVRLRKLDADQIQLTLQRDWEPLARTAQLRRAAAALLLDYLLAQIPTGMRGTDLLAETTLGKLHAAIEADLAIKAQARDIPCLVERALLWLHGQEVLRLGKGLVVFRPAMTIHVGPGTRKFSTKDYAELEAHYREQIIQIHVMAEYARRGLRAAREALRLVEEYFSLSRKAFLKNWFPKGTADLARQTTEESWRRIVEQLDPVQQEIVTGTDKQTNVLVLAGPGSGKTRVLVHRIGYLVRVGRENPRGILALVYNRHAAAEIRRRLRDLIGKDANGVTVLTCHALAMRLTGSSFADRGAQEIDFGRMMNDAVALLEGIGLPPEDADAQRDKLLAGFRWILVDEYQDIGPEQYHLVSAIAGRTLKEPDRQLSIFAVGDDDQNIYEFRGASVDFIRRFGADYHAAPAYLIANYRSTANIIAAANALIAPARDRMKVAHPIEVDHDRALMMKGGAWEARDPVALGRVQVLRVDASAMEQAEQTMRELLRLASLDPEWDWSRAAVIAREWRLLDPVQAFCEAHGIPAQWADVEPPQFWRLRETQALAAWLTEHGEAPLAEGEAQAWIAKQGGGPWWELLQEAADQYALECGSGPLPAAHLREWLAEWGREVRRRQRGLLLLTAHRAKGLEFDHVAVLDGGWDARNWDEERDAARRLYYVAMTRARQTLLLACWGKGNGLLAALPESAATLKRDAPAVDTPTPGLDRRYAWLTPAQVDLGYAGRHTARDPIHAAIHALRPGDPLRLMKKGERWFIEDTQGATVGRLAKSYQPPQGMACESASVHAILTRFADDGEAEYAHKCKCERWEVVLPLLVFGNAE